MRDQKSVFSMSNIYEPVGNGIELAQQAINLEGTVRSLDESCARDQSHSMMTWRKETGGRELGK